MTLSFEPVTGSLGAELKGGKPQDLLQPQTMGELRAALLAHHVLFLRGLGMNLAQQKALTLAFGELIRVPYIDAMENEPDVIAVKKTKEEVKVGVFGGDWHSDFSFLEYPPAGSLLSAVEVPPYGGDTVWANQVAAYDNLPADLKAEVEGKRAVHLGAPYGQHYAPPQETRAGASIKMTRGDPTADEERLHPMVRTHPESGKKALFVNPIYTTRMEDKTLAESRPILERLYKHAIRPDFCCRFRWRKGDMAIWDNRSLMHYAVNDYDGFDRLLYRTTFGDGKRPA